MDRVGFAPQYDNGRRLWFADLTLDTLTATSGPFVRLALVRYQPNALLDAKISRVVLADFAQLTPDRSAVVTSDPYRPRTVNVVVSGVAPRAPSRNRVSVRVQKRDPAVETSFETTPVMAQARAFWYSRARVNSESECAEDGGRPERLHVFANGFASHPDA